jgi:hypothetical protein
MLQYSYSFKPQHEGCITADSVNDLEPLFLHRIYDVQNFRSKFGSNVAADPPDEVHPEGLPVTRELLKEPHNGFADPPSLHENRVEPHDVSPNPQPEGMRMDSFQFQQDTSYVPGPDGDFNLRCFFYCLTVTRTVYISSNPSNPLS